MSTILALDQGTTSSRALVFDRQGHIVAQAQREFAQFYPQPGWVEHDPEEIWQTQRQVAAEALAQAGSVAAIGITNQRETTVLWDRRTHRAIAPAVVWQDRRTADRCEALQRDGQAAWIAQRTGLVIDAYFSATKLAWLLDHIPGARARAMQGELAFGTVDSWLLYRLTHGAVHATDVSNAARTMLLNLQTLTWDTALLELFAIPHQLLPVVVPCGVTTPMGHTDVDGLPRGIPVHAMAGDQQAALFGQVCVRAGMAKNTYGTGCFMLMNTGAQPKASAHRLLATVGWQWDHQTTYALEGSVFVAGAAIQWLRDGLGVIQHAADIGPLAESVSDAGGVTFVPALSGLGAPHWRPHARGAIAGITRGTTRAHLARATLEAIAFQSTELVDAMAQDAEVALQELRVDGGASRCDLLMQMQADFAQVPVVRAAVSETTALGAAFFAGLGCGLWKGVEEIAALWRADRVFYPAIPAAQAAARLARWRESVAQTPSAHP